jgi:peptide/nickel transport system substrate-binding protein
MKRVTKAYGNGRLPLLRPAALIAGVLLVLFVAGCGESSSSSTAGGSTSAAAGTNTEDASAESGSKPTLTIGMPIAPAELNQAQDSNSKDALIVRALSFAPLTHLKQDGTVGPALATSFHYVGPGNKTFEMTLRPDARFSDGTPVTAQAVKEWLMFFPTQHGPFAGAVPFKSIETMGKTKLRINLATPNPSLPLILSEAFNWGFVSSPKTIADPKLLGTQTDGAGPYVLDTSETVPNDHYTFVPNKYYYEPEGIKFSKVVVKIIADPSSLLEAVQTGQVQVAIGDPTTASAAQSAGLEVKAARSGYTSNIAFLDRVSKPLGDVRVRQALNYAINREQIATALMGEYATPSSELPTPDGFVSAYRDYYKYEPEKAKELLKEAGYPNGFSLKVLDVNALGPAGDPMVQAVAQQLEEVGVKLEITTAATYPEYFQRLLSGTFPAAWLFYGNEPTWEIYTEAYKPHAVLNPFGADDPVIDKLWAEGAASEEPGPFWEKISKRSVEQADFLPVFDFSNIFYVSKGIGGVEVGSHGVVPLPTEWFPQ